MMFDQNAELNVKFFKLFSLAYGKTAHCFNFDLNAQFLNYSLARKVLLLGNQLAGLTTVTSAQVQSSGNVENVEQFSSWFPYLNVNLHVSRNVFSPSK